MRQRPRHEEQWAVYRTVIQQCMGGLLGNRVGLHIKNATDFLASDEELIRQLQDRNCAGAHASADRDGSARDLRQVAGL